MCVYIFICVCARNVYIYILHIFNFIFLTRRNQFLFGIYDDIGYVTVNILCTVE